MGSTKLFDEEEEKTLAEHFNHMSYLGYGYLQKDMIIISSDYAIALNKKIPASCLSKTWYERFKKCFPDVNPKKYTTNLSIERANATLAGTVHIHYNLKAIWDSVVNEPGSIYILDEITLPMEQNAEDVYVKTDSNEMSGSDEEKELCIT